MVFLLVQTPSTAIRGACHLARHRPFPSCFSVILSGQGVRCVFISIISILDRNDLRKVCLIPCFWGFSPSWHWRCTWPTSSQQASQRTEQWEFCDSTSFCFPQPTLRPIFPSEFPLEIPIETYLEIKHNLLGCCESFLGTEMEVFEFGGNS